MAMLRRASLSLGRFASTVVVAGRGTALSMPLSSQCRSLPLISPVLCRVHKVITDSSDQETRRRLLNRLLYRSKQRGFLELDLVLGKSVEERLNSLDETGIKHLVQLLDLENPDLWKWLTSQEPPLETEHESCILCYPEEGYEQPQQLRGTRDSGNARAAVGERMG